MERPNIIEAKGEEPTGSKKALDSRVEDAEALSFVEEHRDFLEHYARGGIHFEAAPKGLETFAFNLETDTIYISPRFYKNRGLSKPRTLFATLHEIEHFLEKKRILAEKGGVRKFEQYLDRIKKSKAFAHMDNCVADIHENRSVVSKTNEAMGELEVNMYREDLFKATDFTDRPKHIQLSEALLRESRVPGEECNVAPEVREAIEVIKNTKMKGKRKFMDVLTDPEIPMSLRLEQQNNVIWPQVEALLKQDIEDRKKPKQGEGEGKGEGQGDNGEDEPKAGEGQPSENKEGEEGKPKPAKADDKKIGSPEKGDGEDETADPNKIFAEEYEKAEKRIPNAVPLEEIERALKEWKKAKGGENQKEKADQEYADQIGVIKEELQNYRNIVEQLNQIRNLETNVRIIDELSDLIKRIIANRLKVGHAPKYPVEEGDELVDPAQLVADVSAGNLEPKVWESTEVREKRGERFGEVEITLVCDRSGSMRGTKAIEQQKSAVLMMEVLKEFADICEEEKINVDKPLEIRSEVYSFKSDSNDSIPIKKMSKELGEKERIKVAALLSDTSGGTTDFICLEALYGNLDDETKNKIKNGELKKIVIVFTDGESDAPERVQAVLGHLRRDGIIAVGVGLTKDGSPVMSTYAPEARVVEDVSQLPITIADLLKEHLAHI